MNGDVPVRISVVEVVGHGVCVSKEDATRLYDRIVEVVETGSKVELSFAGVTRMPTFFLNNCVGRLYGVYGDRVREILAPPVDVEAWHLVRIRLTVERAKGYFEARRRERTDVS